MVNDGDKQLFSKNFPSFNSLTLLIISVNVFSYVIYVCNKNKNKILIPYTNLVCDLIKNITFTKQ